MKGIISALLLSVTAFVATPLEAQNAPPGCWTSRDAMVNTLTSDKYNETQMFSGTSLKYARNGVASIEFWVNPDAGNFTYVFAYRNGLYCVGDAGKSIRFGPNEVKTEDDPT